MESSHRIFFMAVVQNFITNILRVYFRKIQPTGGSNPVRGLWSWYLQWVWGRRTVSPVWCGNHIPYLRSHLMYAMCTWTLPGKYLLFNYFWSFASESIVLIGKADWYFTSAPKLAVCVCVHAAHTACSWHRQQQACLQRFPSTQSTPNKTESLTQVEWYITLQSFRRFCAVLRSTC